MKYKNINFIVFFFGIILICFCMNINKKEQFTNELIDSWDIFHAKPKLKLVEITKPNDHGLKGWKSYYRDNYLKGNVDYHDNFKGTMIRNYLDNLNFFKN